MRLKNEQGITIVLVALLMTIFIGVAAFAIDIGHLHVVRNELQNAADAGALAGARFLYTNDGNAINTNANQIAYDAATANNSEKTPVEVNWIGGNGEDVQRGHWSFATRTFTPNDSTEPFNLWDHSTEELDADPNFINAVRVKTRRESTPAASFFARNFGYENFSLSAEAIAYIGFAGTLAPKEVDQPIAICKEALLVNGEYTCTIGRMINSGRNVASQQTGGWTDFSQDNPCLGGTNAQTVRSLVCGQGNPNTIFLGRPIAITGGEIASAFGDLIKCWDNITKQVVPWNLTLLVVTCPGNNVSTCEEVVGAVDIKIVWITGAGEDPHYKNAPRQMLDWSSDDPDGQVRWESFVQYFHLQNLDGTPAPYEKKSIYFLPDCKPHEPTGRTGGKNFGILAKIPVLVK